MRPERWSQLESLYDRALQLDETQRSAFLREACGSDEDLRRDLEELLAEGPHAASFLENPVLRKIAPEFAATAAASHQYWIGRRIGNYEFLSMAGAGGMGEVYRARDTKLNRQVAIKILPAGFSRDTERVSRFRREAQFLAALNHPNIGAIYDLEEEDGVLFVILEFVEGEMLADRLKRGPIPVETALKIALQIAEALEAAHEKSVIHRDLKPANIKFAADGKVKVLDFGLAKALLNDSNVNLSNSPTLSTAGTQQGVILGTAAYMSPEQARGEAVDRRADVWAFGCVLFEMLCGRGTFGGKTVTDILASVLKTAPDWSSLPANLHPRILYLLERCLEKEPQDRCQGLADARVEIKKALTDSGGVPTMPAAKTSRGLRSAITAIFVLISIVLAAVLIYVSRTPGDAAVVRFVISSPDKTIFDSTIGSTSISPNGRKVAFAAKDEAGKMMLWVRSLDTLIAQPLQGTEGASLPFWSPDSRSIAFFAQAKLKKIDVEGGPPLPLGDAPRPSGGAWNRDGLIVFSGNFGVALSRVSEAGGESVAVTKLLPEQQLQGHPAFLPDGRHFFYFAGGAGKPENSGVFIGSLDSLEGQRLLTANSSAIYSQPGYVLFVREGTLLAQPFDARKMQVTGESIPIADFNGRAVDFSVSENGILAYRTGAGPLRRLQLTWVDRTGTLVGLMGSPDQYQGLDISPDGQRVAVHRHEGTGGDIWIMETSGGRTSRFTHDPTQENSMPTWSADGSRIVFGSRRNGKWGIYQKLYNGVGNDELLFESDVLKMPMSWPVDGKTLVYWVLDPTGRYSGDAWALPLAGNRKPFPVLQTSFNEQHPQISPDGKWIAYGSNETVRSEIYVQSFPPGPVTRQVSGNGGVFARWRPDGKELFFIELGSSGKLVSAEIRATGSTFEFLTPRPLFDSGYVNTGSGHLGDYSPYAVSSDGQRFLIPRPEAVPVDAPTNTPITVVLNWTAILKK